MPYRWKKADASDGSLHCPNHEDKRLYYARVYTPGGGFACSESNQLILNLKIAPTAAANRQYYKNDAIEKFAQEVAVLLNRENPRRLKFVIVPVPTSKVEGTDGYDDRIMRVANRIAELCPHVTVIPLLRRSRTVSPLHSSTAARNADVVYQTIKIDVRAKARFPEDTNLIILLDDVATSGATFEGCRKRLRRNA